MMNSEQFKKWLVGAEFMLEHRGFTSLEIDKILEFFTNIRGSNENDLIGSERVNSFVKFVDGEYFDVRDAMTARLFIYAPYIVNRLPKDQP